MIASYIHLTLSGDRPQVLTKALLRAQKVFIASSHMLLMCFPQLSLESNVTPRYLASFTSFRSLPPSCTPLIGLTLYLVVNNIMLTLSGFTVSRTNSHQACTIPNACCSSPASTCSSSAFTSIRISSA